MTECAIQRFTIRIKEVMQKMKEYPDTLEQGVWAIIALFWGLSFEYIERNEVFIVTVIFSILISATIFWSYFQKL